MLSVCLILCVESVCDAVFPMSDIAMQVVGPKKSEFEKYTALPMSDHKMFEPIIGQVWFDAAGHSTGNPCS